MDKQILLNETEGMLYVLSEPWAGKPTLLGYLYFNKADTWEESFSFKYAYPHLTKFPKWYMQVDGFPDMSKTYKGKEVWDVIERFVGDGNSIFAKAVMMQDSLTEWNPWYVLNRYAQSDPQQLMHFKRKLPEETNIYE